MPYSSAEDGEAQRLPGGRVDPMQIPFRPSPRETTEAMVRNIARELAEIEQAIRQNAGVLGDSLMDTPESDGEAETPEE